MEQSIERRVLVFLFLLAAVGSGWAAETQSPGDKAFNTTCFACHTIGGGRLVGPDLAGIQDKRTHEWLVKFIASSMSMVREGDPEAIAIVEEYNGLIMPDAALSTAEIEAVLSYIASQADSAKVSVIEELNAPDVQPASVSLDPTPTGTAEQTAERDSEQISRGRGLFDGTIDLENSGPTCNACHHVVDDAVLGGGTLAAELTTVFSRMSAPGIQAIISQAPFPAMQAAYVDKPLTADEVSDLAAYLQHVNTEHMNQMPKDYGMRLFAGGVVGSAALFGFCGLVWRGRKRGSVNQDIYDRQLKSD